MLIAIGNWIYRIAQFLHFMNLPILEYNLEFQGSIRNLQKKRAPFMKFYPEVPWNNREMC